MVDVVVVVVFATFYSFLPASSQAAAFSLNSKRNTQIVFLLYGTKKKSVGKER